METQTQFASSEQRTKMLQRVLNLRSRAEDAGSSEAEMNTAMTMCQKLMDSYNIEEAELAIAEASGEIKLEIVQKVADSSVLKGKRQKHKIIACLSGIAKFTETRVVLNTYNGSITFTGHRPDTELADFLTGVIRSALDREYDNWRRDMPAVGYGAKSSFQNAMAIRISNRLRDMADERDDLRVKNKRAAQMIENTATASSTALIICDIAEQKAKEVNAEFNKAHPRLRSVATSTRSTNGTAHGAGRVAGDRVNLGRAIGANSQKALA